MSSVRLDWIVVLAISLAVPAASRAGGDAAAGERKSLTCAACHVSPDPASDTPYLAGQRAGYLAAQLQAFRQGDRAHPLMDVVARQLGDADIDDLAAFWSRQPGGNARLTAAVERITKSHMEFPRDFPNGFVLYLTSNDAEHNTIEKHYINAKGFEAARRKRPLPEGSVIIQIHCLARLGPDKQPLHDKAGAWVVDKITSYTGMEARAGWGNDIPAWLRNADWNYGSFTVDRAPNSSSNQAVCLACHKAQDAVGYVFTFNELWDRAHEN
jgi:cytochrome c553